MKCPSLSLSLTLACLVTLVAAGDAWSQKSSYYRGNSNVHVGYAARLGVGGARQKQKTPSCGIEQPSASDDCGQCCKCQPLLGRLGCVVQVFQCRLCGKLKRARRQASCSLSGSLAGWSKGCANCPRSTCGSCANSCQSGSAVPAPRPVPAPAPTMERWRLPPDPFVDDPQARTRRSPPSIMLRAALRANVFSDKAISFRISDR